MKTQIGERKLAVNRQSGAYLFAGLLCALVAAGYFRLDTAICVQAFAIYTAGIIGKDSAFVWGNAKSKEHSNKTENKTIGG